MARLQILWVQDQDFLSFPEIAGRPGYYLDVLTGDLFRNAGHFTEANRRILSHHRSGSPEDPLNRKPFLLVTPDLHRSLEEVKELAATRYGVSVELLGKLVHSME